jgi:hypothetical protein
MKVANQQIKVSQGQTFKELASHFSKEGNIEFFDCDGNRLSNGEVI